MFISTLFIRVYTEVFPGTPVKVPDLSLYGPGPHDSGLTTRSGLTRVGGEGGHPCQGHRKVGTVVNRSRRLKHGPIIHISLKGTIIKRKETDNYYRL